MIFRKSSSPAPAELPAERPSAVATVERPEGRRLGDLLLAREAITPHQLTTALLEQSASGQRLGTVLVDLGILDERVLAAAVAEQAELVVVDLSVRTPAPEALALLPESVARAERVLPMEREGELLVVATAEPTDALLAKLRTSTGLDVVLVVAPASEITRALEANYRSLSGVEEQVRAFEASDLGTRKAPAREQVVVDDDAPVVRVVDMLLLQALRDRASDVHIEPQDEQVRVRFRIDGALNQALVLPSSMASGLVSRIKIMAGMNIVERRRPQDGQMALTLDGRAVDVRVATTGTVFGEKVVLRILDKSRSAYKLGDLGMPEETHKAFSRLVHSPYGMVVCAGPTGSGKTTTLYASLSEVDSVERNITTIEDPVEYVFPNLTQIQINEAAGLSFASGLRSVLRQDPDVVLVGEIRDAETARIAVQAALTGHLVMSSLHATDAVSALYRFLDMGIEAFLVASSLQGVVGQRLVRRTCSACREHYTPTAEELAFYREAGGKAKRTFWVGRGCNFCAGTGYADRVGVYELMAVSEQMRQLIVQPNPSREQMRDLAVEQGMSSLRAQAVDLVQRDVTTIAEVVRTIYTL